MNRIRTRFLLTSFCLMTTLLVGQTIRYSAEKKLWIIDSGSVSYALGVNERGELQHLYWGGSIGAKDGLQPAKSKPEWASFDVSTNTTPQEFPSWGAGLFVEPALKVKFATGNRDVVLHYLSHEISGNKLRVTMKDVGSELRVTLDYEAFADTGLIGRSITIKNGTGEIVTVEDAQSAAWTLPRADYRLRYLTGRWAGEWQLQSEEVKPGRRVLESRRGSTSHEANPWFALESPDATEDSGEVYFGALAWSGSWKFTIERTNLGITRVTGGFNDFDFEYSLKPGESLTTPVFYAGYTAQGLGEAARLLHRFERDHILPARSRGRLRPVLYNSWEATEFNVNEGDQEALAEKAAKIGVERFVIDDGWFGQRNDDHAGLGDWYVNPKKFPNGLKPLIDKVHSLGMDFGIWVEPEMVNPNSDLYRKHPDWAMHFEGRQRTEARNQLVLNLARDDVKEYVFSFLDKLVSENDIAFLKWDYNRNWTEPGWPEAALDNQQKIYIQYVRNLYDIIDRLRAKHPKLEIESCSGGGGRVDLGIMQRTEQVWTSDNTDAFDRLTMQDGFSYAYTPKVMMAWVTDVPNGINGRVTSLKYRFLVALQGSLGIGSNLNKWSGEEFASAANMIAFYKQIRPVVQNGKLYRLISPQHSNYAASQYLSEDGKEGVVFAFLHSQQYAERFPTVRPKGLDPAASYTLEAIDKSVSVPSGPVSGSFLMNHGVEVNLRGDFDATAFRIKRID